MKNSYNKTFTKEADIIDIPKLIGNGRYFINNNLGYSLSQCGEYERKRRTIAAGLTYITELKYVVGKVFREDFVDEDRADYIYLQPESSEPRYIQKAMEVLMHHPDWRLSCRVHKILELP